MLQYTMQYTIGRRYQLCFLINIRKNTCYENRRLYKILLIRYDNFYGCFGCDILSQDFGGAEAHSVPLDTRLYRVLIPWILSLILFSWNSDFKLFIDFSLTMCWPISSAVPPNQWNIFIKNVVWQDFVYFQFYRYNYFMLLILLLLFCDHVISAVFLYGPEIFYADQRVTKEFPALAGFPGQLFAEIGYPTLRVIIIIISVIVVRIIISEYFYVVSVPIYYYYFYFIVRPLP